MFIKIKINRSNFTFKFENKTVDYCEQYRYLGVTLNESLNFEEEKQNNRLRLQEGLLVV